MQPASEPTAPPAGTREWSPIPSYGRERGRGTPLTQPHLWGCRCWSHRACCSHTGHPCPKTGPDQGLPQPRPGSPAPQRAFSLCLPPHNSEPIGVYCWGFQGVCWRERHPECWPFITIQCGLQERKSCRGRLSSVLCLLHGLEATFRDRLD